MKVAAIGSAPLREGWLHDQEKSRSLIGSCRRGGVVKLSSTTDLVPNLPPSRGMKRMRFENRAVLENVELMSGSGCMKQESVLESLDHTTPAFGHPSSC